MRLKGCHDTAMLVAIQNLCLRFMSSRILPHYKTGARTHSPDFLSLAMVSNVHQPIATIHDFTSEIAMWGSKWENSSLLVWEVVKIHLSGQNCDGTCHIQSPAWLVKAVRSVWWLVEQFPTHLIYLDVLWILWASKCLWIIFLLPMLAGEWTLVYN